MSSLKPLDPPPAPMPDATEELLELVLSPPPRPERIDGVVVGRLVALEPPTVVFPGSDPAGAPARATGASLFAGAEVALMFEGGDPAKPIILGPMAKVPAGPPAAQAPLSLQTDGERVTLTAQQELVLRCGDASITLTKEGKILIRGAYVSSRSTGVHRIQGGSVEIN